MASFCSLQHVCSNSRPYLFLFSSQCIPFLSRSNKSDFNILLSLVFFWSAARVSLPFFIFHDFPGGLHLMFFFFWFFFFLGRLFFFLFFSHRCACCYGCFVASVPSRVRFGAVVVVRRWYFSSFNFLLVRIFPFGSSLRSPPCVPIFVSFLFWPPALTLFTFFVHSPQDIFFFFTRFPVVVH